LGNFTKFYLTIITRELASDSISFPNFSPIAILSTKIRPKIDGLLKEFADIVQSELPGELPPLRDIQHAINLVSVA